ncbi:cyclic nucleotide-binding domain-containing protein [Candidatus Fermentibacteria bacterium]|nr:cyclic nucleotide-binding domain-containing protein [Candidatus Fermentibacteria bacterium]
MEGEEMRVGQLFAPDNTLLESEIAYFYDQMTLENEEGLIFQGELTTDFYIVSEGQLEVVEGTGEDAIRLAVLNEDDVFGEVSFFDGQERSATVRSIGTSKVLRMTREQLAEIAARQPMLGLRILICLGRVAAEKLRKTDQLVSGVAGKSKIKGDKELKKLVSDIRKMMSGSRKGIFG